MNFIGEMNFLAVVGFELRASHLLATPPTLSLVLGIFEIGSLEQFLQAGHESRSS
jgi:hypothetical protein